MSKFSKLVLSNLIIIIGVVLIWYGFDTKRELSVSSLPTPSPTLSESTRSAAQGIDGERVLVVEVVDGDTVKLATGQTVRLIGIDTPETKDPRKPVQCFGKEASSETKKLIEGKEVILERDVSETDMYKRLLRYIFLPLDSGQLLFVNDYLIREGFATALTYPPDVKYTERFLEAEGEAKRERKGLWGRC